MENQQLLFFAVGDKTYGMDVLKIESIERVGNITRVPRAPEAIIGVMNLRGNILPILSFRQKLGMELCKFDNQTRIIVLDDEDNRVGLLVDKVMDVGEVDMDRLYTIDEASEDGTRSFIQGALRYQNEALVTILDANKLLKQ